MKLTVHRLFWIKTWICAAVGLTVAVAIHFALIQPSILLVIQRDEAETSLKEQEESYQRSLRILHSIESDIEGTETRLAELGGAPPPENRKDIIVAQLTNLAVEDGITVEQFTPLDTLEASDHRAFYVQFTGQGSYAAWHRYLRRIEEEHDFVDITHMTLSRSSRNANPVCLIQWSCRINTQRGDEEFSSDRIGGQATRPLQPGEVQRVQ